MENANSMEVRQNPPINFGAFKAVAHLSKLLCALVQIISSLLYLCCFIESLGHVLVWVVAALLRPALRVAYGVSYHTPCLPVSSDLKSL